MGMKLGGDLSEEALEKVRKLGKRGEEIASELQKFDSTALELKKWFPDQQSAQKPLKG